MRRIAGLALMLTLAAAPAASAAGAPAPAPPMQAVIVKLRTQADLAGLPGGGRRARLDALVSRLQTTAAAQQARLRTLLAERRREGLVARVRPLWVVDAIAVTAAPSVIDELRARPEVAGVTGDGTFAAPAGAGTGTPEPNLATIGAPDVWSTGDTGQGVVVASLDTGVDIAQPELAARWRGGTNSWFDPYGEHPTTPTDVSGHGTHVMGVMVGGDGGGTAVGVAPGATWIAAKIFNDQGTATASAIHLAFQWVLDPDGNPATADAPQVVNSSWSMSPGCNLAFEPDIQALRAAGILPVFAAGNSGPGSPSDYSPANNPGALAVGATTAADAISPDSSRGPTACGQPQTTYPSLVAPGVGITTTDLLGRYTSASGTSLAAPHVSGALALLLSAHPGLSADAQEAALLGSALDLGDPGADNVFGAGRLDVDAAYRAVTGGADDAGPEVTGIVYDAGSRTLRATAADTASPVAAAEWFDGADPGAGNGISMAAADGVFDAPTEQVTAMPPLLPGAHLLAVRARDAAGNWGPAARLAVTTPDPGAIFADGFGGGGLSAWTRAKGAGGLTVTPLAALHGADGLGLRAAVRGTQAHLLVDASPARESAYAARFFLRADSSATDAGGWTVFDARDGARNPVLALAYHRSGPGSGTPALRALAYTTSGRAVAGAWIPMAAGAHAVELDWAAGASGGLTLRLDGTAVSRLAGAGSWRSGVQAARLGAVGGLGASARGTLDIDDFASRRAGPFGS